MPKVLNKYLDVIPKDAIYIGRPSRWGNPYQIGKDGNRSKVIEKYRLYLLSNPNLLKEAKTFLRGKDLVCFCSPKSCHGDILISLVNLPIVRKIPRWKFMYRV